MKTNLSVASILLCFKGFAHSPAETTIPELSCRIFTWEVGNKVYSVDGVFLEMFTAFAGAGELETAFVKNLID